MREEIKATLTYNGKTADMEDKPAAEALMKEMITAIQPELKGGHMTGVRIEIKRIAGMNLKIKEGDGTNVVLAIETFLPPGDIARIYNLSKQGVPVSAVIESPQAELDLVFHEVNTFTGEIALSKEPVAAGT